jgi:hypothetical protein
MPIYIYIYIYIGVVDVVTIHSANKWQYCDDNVRRM